jgi:hypothetical protein
MYYALLAWFSRGVEFLSERLLRRWVVAAVVIYFFSAAMLTKQVPWIIDPAVVAAWFLASLWLLNRMIRRERESA